MEKEIFIYLLHHHHMNISPEFFVQHTLTLHSLSKSFLERHLVLLQASVVSSNVWSFLFSFILIDALGAVERYPPADAK